MAEIIVPLDVASRAEALALVDRLPATAGFYKVGLELFTRAGPSVIDALRERGKRVFLDLKLHDIPNTVAGAVHAAAEAGVDLLTVHATGGQEMLTAAAEASAGRVRLLGVTLLTSLSVTSVEATWGRSLTSIREEVLRLAAMVRDAGVDGVVSSPLEAEALRRRFGPDLLIVTPGIRLAGGDTHDQARVATPRSAAEAGADYVVVGRAITAAPDPVRAFGLVLDDLAAAESPA